MKWETAELNGFFFWIFLWVDFSARNKKWHSFYLITQVVFTKMSGIILKKKEILRSAKSRSVKTNWNIKQLRRCSIIWNIVTTFPYKIWKQPKESEVTKAIQFKKLKTKKFRAQMVRKQRNRKQFKTVSILKVLKKLSQNW